MATIEKPKLKRKKKTKSETDESLKSTSLSTINQEDLDVHFPSSSKTSDKLITHECFVSAEFQSLAISTTLEQSNELENEVIEATQIDQQLDFSENTETALDKPKSGNLYEELISAGLNIEGSPQPWTANIEEPSAPSITTSDIKCLPHYTFEPITKYSDLTSIQNNEQFCQNVYKAQINKKVIVRPNPMTRIQMNKLYHCSEIEMVRQFELEFLANSLHQNFDNDPLYILLQQYALARSKLRVNLIDMENIRKQLKTMESEVWKTKNVNQTFYGKCNDNTNLKVVENYDIETVDGVALQNLSLNLNKLYELACFSYTTNNINAEIAKLKIKQIIREILSYPSFSKINSTTPVKIQTSMDTLMLQGISQLRRGLSILFNCIRKPSPDKIFSDDIKSWIVNLVALYLRVSTIQDHWFLLFHLLRCPSSISDWTTSFLQVPNPENTNNIDILKSPEINHCISVLHILLLPIKKRNEFLIALSKSHKDISDPVKDDIWILVDSDGEEGCTSSGECTGLKEKDFISFLNQIPLEMVFRCAINAKKVKDVYVIETDAITEKQLLKLIAFYTNLVELFGEGLLTYNTERYKQFAKRLGRLIRHTIHYVSDIHEMFLQNNLSKDPYLCEQISVEMNAFIIKSCSYIYKTPNLATWQYFSSLPFAFLDSDTLWQLLLYLNVGFPEDFPVANEDYKKSLDAKDFWNRFNIAVSDLSPEDLYYLIQTFFEMANERDRIKDWDFIETICSHIFVIGFINESTREICYKTSRDMLTNLTLTYPELIASIIQQLKVRFNETENAIYLIKSLPLENWKTDIQSFEILSFWLINYNYDFKENILARVIISHLNWGYDTDNRLFLPHNIHVRMACLVCEALNKHNPEIVGSSGISESVRQVSSLIENQTSKEKFTLWCWNMISLLRLHLMDQNNESIRKILQNPSEHLCFIPDLENFEIIFQGISEGRPIAMYISILISLWGHSIPLICQKGFGQMKHLLTDYRHSTVIRCIQLITPLFLESPDILAKCESFQEILKIIFDADRTYLKMAKNLVMANSPGPVCEHFTNMMHCQIINYVEFGLTIPTPLINLWLEILTSIPNWQNMNILYLVDSVVKIAYQFPDSWRSCKDIFREYYKNCDDWKSDRASTFKIFLGSSNQNKNFPTLSIDCGWISLLLLELEHETQECMTSLWPEFLRNLLNSSEKNFENILKKSCTSVGYQQFSSSTLVIYKLANLIAVADINHPLFPIFNQKFFELYLVRVVFKDDEESFQHTFGVADKFYEHNISLMKKLKLKLKQAEENYDKLSQENVENEIITHFYSQCSMIMKTYLLWLEETNINKISKDQHIDLPPQYNPEKLKDIFIKNEHHWTEFLYLRAIRDEQKKTANNWLKFCFRLHNIPRRPSEIFNSNHRTNAMERIKKHLKSYDEPLSPPNIELKPLILSPLSPKDISRKTLESLRKELKFIEENTRKFNLKAKEINSLNGNFKDQIQTLYKNVPYSQNRVVTCVSMFNKECTGPANISVTLKRPQKMESVQRKLTQNRELHDQIIEELLNQNVDKLVYSTQKLEFIVRYLLIAQCELQEKGTLNENNVSDVAVNFFYDILKTINDNIKTVIPCYDVCSSIVRELGVFIQNNQETQGIKILEMALKRPDLLKLLSDLFMPSKTGTEHFIEMYKFLVDSHMRRCDTKIIFVLMSKFDLPNWLQVIRPKLSEINNLLKLILRGLENWNQPETSILQDLFRRHLVHIFDHEFPEHYGEVLQIILNAVSEQKIASIILLDLLNSLLQKTGCDILTLESPRSKINEQIEKFATQQNVFNFKIINETIQLFSRHFQNERLQHGLHGLYPKHKNYCLALSIWFSCLSHTIVVSAICSYPGVLGDQICDWVFAPIVDMYSPWIVIYREQELQQSTANWIKQFITNGKILYPWSENHEESAEIILQSFLKSLQYILEILPVSNSILGHVYSWYQYHFAGQDVKQQLRSPIHSTLIQLPWERFCPQINHIESFFRLLNEFLPECHSFLGYIFVRIQWSDWIKECFYTWPLTSQNHVINLMLTIFVEISFEPHVHDDLRTSKILCESLNFPWDMIDIKGVESVFNWLTLSVDPSIVLKIESESNEVDKAVLILLQRCSCMLPMKSNNVTFQVKSKRILYVKTVVRLLRSCSSKYQKLLETSEGLKSYQTAVLELLCMIENITMEESVDSNREVEIQNLISEIYGSLQSQSEFTSKLFVDAIIHWQSTCNIGNSVLCSTLNALSLSKKFTFSMYSLIEATIYNYFRFSSTDNYTPTWMSVFQRLANSLDHLDFQTLFKGPYLLTLHTYILYKIQNTNDLGVKLTFLQDLSQLLQNVKTSETTEPRIIIVWGAIISCGGKILNHTENARKPLLMLARHLQDISKQSEGWGNSLLGAIGLRRDKAQYRQKILSRCLCCMIFALFPDKSSNDTKQSQEFTNSLEELKFLISNKAYIEIKPQIIKSIEIIEEHYYPTIEQVRAKIFEIIQIFYSDNFIRSAQEVWDIEKCL